MGLVFKSEEERNPIIQNPSQPEDQCAEIKAQLDEINQFIDENNLLKNFYMWQEIKHQLEGTGAEVIDDKDQYYHQ